MKRLLGVLLPIAVIAVALTVRVDAQVAPFRGVVGSGPAWDQFVKEMLERARSGEIPPAPEREPESLESPSYFPEGEFDSREALAGVVASMMQALAPDLLPSGYRLRERDPRMLQLLYELPPDLEVATARSTSPRFRRSPTSMTRS
jgi:hypothetical protein